MIAKYLFPLGLLILTLQCKTYGTKHSILNNQQIWSLMADSKVAVDALASLSDNGFIDILNIDGSKVNFRVFPESSDFVKQNLELLNYQPTVEVKDLPKFLEDVDEENRLFSEIQTEAESCTLTNCSQLLTSTYMTFQQIEWYLQSLASNYPTIVNKTSLGKTKEGRDIWLVKLISSSVVANKSIWIEGGIHAREWIAPAVTLQLLDNLVKNASLVAGIDYYFVPMANPDGYVFTKTTNRMWRKNRATTSKASCPGVDLNRNWNFNWGVGASTNPCTEVYKGTAPFSQPETKAMSDKISKITNLRMGLAIHSFSQLLLYPWGWTAAVAPDTAAMISLGTEFVNEVYKINKRIYKAVNSATGLYYASGTTSDWIKGVALVKYSYTLELGDTGTYGFILPASDILPYGKEIWSGFVVMINRIKQEP